MPSSRRPPNDSSVEQIELLLVSRPIEVRKRVGGSGKPHSTIPGGGAALAPSERGLSPKATGGVCFCRWDTPSVSFADSSPCGGARFPAAVAPGGVSREAAPTFAPRERKPCHSEERSDVGISSTDVCNMPDRLTTDIFFGSWMDRFTTIPPGDCHVAAFGAAPRNDKTRRHQIIYGRAALGESA